MNIDLIQYHTDGDECQNSESELAYGIEFDTASSSATCTRIGNLNLHKSLPIQSRMKGCLLGDDGTVNYLPVSDWTSSVRDGSRGQVMVEIPQHYRKFVTDGTKRRVWMSEYQIPGYTLVPKHYVSAYQAVLDRENSKLASVINTSTNYRGGNNTATYDSDTYRSLLGRPVSSISLTNFRTFARNRNTSNSAWNCMTYGTHKTIYWLFVVEYATLNCQLAYNSAKTSEGYAQGGLGDGVTNADYTKWSTLNGVNPFIPCGVTDAYGNNSCSLQKVIYTDSSESEIFVTTYVPRYRGIENPFGHIWQWTDGVLVNIASGDDGLSEVFVASNPANFASDLSGSGYAHVGNEARTSGWGKTHIFGNGGEMIPAEMGGGSTEYLCDYHYTDIPTSGSATRGVLFGGSALYGAYAGFAFASSGSAPSDPATYIGSRLCYIPTTD